MITRRGLIVGGLAGAATAVTSAWGAVNGYLAKDGSPLANARSITLSDGRKVFAGSSIETESNP